MPSWPRARVGVARHNASSLGRSPSSLLLLRTGAPPLRCPGQYVHSPICRVDRLVGAERMRMGAPHWRSVPSGAGPLGLVRLGRLTPVGLRCKKRDRSIAISRDFNAHLRLVQCKWRGAGPYEQQIIAIDLPAAGTGLAATPYHYG
uniref:Uncharacterized protein n=1 Tax=Oryza rufipogon TaxID=4529 RepID=A0A0E0NPA1_ORYRU